MSLIPRFYDPTSGAVAIDGIDVREVSVRSLRRQIGFVLQDTQLFYAPVSQNIAYGQPDATRDEIVARRASSRRRTSSSRRCPTGYDTMVGQGGLHPVGRTAAAARHRARDGARRARF